MNVSLNTGTETRVWVFTKKCSFGHFEQV